jgi:uncharacterized protein
MPTTAGRRHRTGEGRLTKIRPIMGVFAFALAYGCVASAAQTTTMVAPSAAACAAFRGIVSRAICGDPELVRLNRQMRVLYRKAQFVGDRRSQAVAQWRWIIERNRTCGRVPASELKACVAQLLSARMVELRHVFEQGQASIERTVVTAQPSQPPTVKPVCSNQIGPVNRTICNEANLGHWEDRLGKLYQQALDDPPVHAILAADQARWIGERAESCAGLPPAEVIDCVLRMTKRRVEELAEVINSRDDSQDRVSKVEKILAGQTAPPPGLGADAIDRESDHADQSDLVLADARTCIQKNAGSPGGTEAHDDRKVEELLSSSCFSEFSKRMSALELGALAKSSFEMLVQRELGVRK